MLGLGPSPLDGSLLRPRVVRERRRRERALLRLARGRRLPLQRPVGERLQGCNMRTGPD
jgi:hypothetical protein